MINILYVLINLYPNAPISWRHILLNGLLNFDMILELMPLGYCNIHMLSTLYDKLDCEMIEKRIDIWDFETLSRSDKITIEFVNKYIFMGWDWYRLSLNTKIATCENIDNYPSFPWDIYVFSRNKNITEEFIEKHIDDVPWDWRFLTYNNNISLKFIKKYIDKEWGWYHVMEKFNISFDEINIMRMEKATSTHKSMHYLKRKLFMWMYPDFCSPIHEYTVHSRSEHIFENNIPSSTLTNKNNNNDNSTWEYCFSHLEMNQHQNNLKYIIRTKYITFNDIKKLILLDVMDWEELSKNKYINETYLIKKYCNIWKNKTKLINVNRKMLYDPVLDMLKLRIRDVKNGIRISMINFSITNQHILS